MLRKTWPYHEITIYSHNITNPLSGLAIALSGSPRWGRTWRFRGCPLPSVDASLSAMRQCQTKETGLYASSWLTLATRVATLEVAVRGQTSSLSLMTACMSWLSSPLQNLQDSTHVKIWNLWIFMLPCNRMEFFPAQRRIYRFSGISLKGSEPRISFIFCHFGIKDVARP